MANKKKIFITGVSGYLGKNLQNNLEKLKSFDITCYSRKKIPNINTIIGDLSETKKIEKATKNIDIVLHIASEGSSKNPIKTFKTNVAGTKNLVISSKKNKVKKFIYISSTFATHDFNTPYSNSKKKAEEIIKNLLDNYIILRPSEIYGGIDSSHYKTTIDNMKKKKILFISGGNNLVQPTYVRDVINSIVKSVYSNELKKTFFLVGRKPIKKSTLFKALRNKFNKKCTLIFVPDFIAYFIIKLIYPLLGKQKSWKEYKDNIVDMKYQSDFDSIDFKEGINYIKYNENMSS